MMNAFPPMTRIVPLLLCLSLGLGGCTLIPHYERPGAPIGARYPGGSAATGAKASSEIAWREFFADARLKKLIELALEDNRDLRVAMLNVEQSRAQYRIARAGFFPTIQAAGSYIRQGGVGKAAR